MIQSLTAYTQPDLTRRLAEHVDRNIPAQPALVEYGFRQEGQAPQTKHWVWYQWADGSRTEYGPKGRGDELGWTTLVSVEQARFAEQF